MKPTPLKLQRLFLRLHKIGEQITGTSGQTYVWHRVDEYRRMWQKAADHLGAEFSILTGDLWEIRKNGKKTRILNDKLQFDDPVTLNLAGMKPVVYRLLSEAKLRVPESRCYKLEDWYDVSSFLKRHPHGCAVKPAHGTSSGQGVTTHVMTLQELKKASILASLYCHELLIEPMIAGESYRLLVFKGDVLQAVRRRGLRLTADGTASIAELYRRHSGITETQGRRIARQDWDFRFTLSYQELTPDSIPAAGQQILVRSMGEPKASKAEVRTVYDEDVSGLVCAALKNDAVQAAKIVGSDFLGVDFITTDPTVPLAQSGGVINEVNTTPGMHHHYNPTTEAYPKVAIQLLKDLLG
ncbi:MAG: hypothetical protein C4519_04480 [Desulfobacteraceae bacterium]|nr:MAG: hypothetical protein C4519_04480 [Desulfobacteraceae bacterium]